MSSNCKTSVWVKYNIIFKYNCSTNIGFNNYDDGKNFNF